MAGLWVASQQTDQAFGTLARRMVARGLIERAPGPGRVIRHRLTDEGERVRRAGVERMEGVFADSFRPLSAAEQETLRGLLARLLGHDADAG